MAHTLTPKESYALMNELVHQATGQKSIAVIDSSSFVSAGETVLATGTENVMNSLAIVIGRTIAAVRPYNAKLQVIQAINTAMYSNRLRKVSFYSQDNVPAGNVNTDQNTNLADGYDNGVNSNNSTKSMWDQRMPVVLEMNFSGSDVWQYPVTMYEDALKAAFRNESEFGQFVGGILTSATNDMESTKEAFNRLTLLNYMGGLYDLANDMPGTAINLTAAFNAKFGTSYTSADLRTTHLTEFAKFFTAVVKKTANYMEERSANFHWTPTKAGHSLLRHTPKSKLKCLLYQPLFTDAEAIVMPEIFNPQYLDIKNYEGVSYWQNNADEDDRPMINVTPAIPDTALNTGAQKTGDNVNVYVVGVMFDEDAMMVDYQLDRADTTPLEARKHYRNTWYSFSKNAICDFTENGVLFYMEDAT